MEIEKRGPQKGSPPAAQQWGHPLPTLPVRAGLGAVLTPAVWHDFQGQGHQVVKGGIQDHSTNVWVGHGCPRGWCQDREEG